MYYTYIYLSYVYVYVHDSIWGFHFKFENGKFVYVCREKDERNQCCKSKIMFDKTTKPSLTT